MCRLLGIIARSSFELAISLQEAPAQFAARGENNPDGWGMGWFEEGSSSTGALPGLVRKHELPARGDLTGDQASAAATSSLIVAHVRRSSRAPRSLRNTHPFSHDGWLFAHNGALYPLLEVAVRRKVGRAALEGQSDSEALFRLLLQAIGEQRDPVAGIRAAVLPLTEDGQLSALNFVLARAGELYAFRYAARSASYYTLGWRRRVPGRELDAASRDTHARIQSRGLSELECVLVCSEDLETGPEGWEPLANGELLTVRSSSSSLEASVTFLSE